MNATKQRQWDELVEDELDRERLRIWTPEGEHYDTNAEMLARLRSEVARLEKES